VAPKGAAHLYNNGNGMKEIIKQVTTTTDTATTYALGTADVVSAEMKKTIETHVAPVRKSVLKRYPVFFSMLALFGLATTYYAFEKILSQYEILNQYPWLILLLGVSVLTFTGTLYKKMK